MKLLFLNKELIKHGQQLHYTSILRRSRTDCLVGLGFLLDNQLLDADSKSTVMGADASRCCHVVVAGEQNTLDLHLQLCRELSTIPFCMLAR